MNTPAPEENGQLKFARSAIGPLGHLEHEASTMLDTPTHELFLKYCSRNGFRRADVLRDCIYVLMYGKSFGQMVAERFEHEADRMKALSVLKAPFFPLESSQAD